MKRSGPIVSIVQWGSDDPGCNVRLTLVVDGRRQPFIIRFNSDRELFNFQPVHFDLSSMSQGLGYDSVMIPGVRERCIAAVNHMNRRLRWPQYGSPAIQRVGSNFIITYLAIPPSEQRKHIYLDPYVSFLVTPKGTILVGFFGA